MLRWAAIAIRSAVAIGLTLSVMAGLFWLLYSYPFLIFIIAPIALWLLGMLSDHLRQRRRAKDAWPSTAQSLDQ